MRFTVKLPKLGDTVDEVVIIKWFAAPGDQISEGDPLLLVETDKAEVEVPSPLTGLLTEILVAVDDEVRTGQPIAIGEN